MFVLGVAAFIKTGIRANSYLGHFRMGELLPFSKSSVATLSFFAAIAFIYTGIELSSVYLPRLKHPPKPIFEASSWPDIHVRFTRSLLGLRQQCRCRHD